MPLIEYFYPIIGFIITFLLTRFLAYMFIDNRFGHKAKWEDFSTGPIVICLISIFINFVIAMSIGEIDVAKYVIHGLLLPIGLQVGIVLGAGQATISSTTQTKNEEKRPMGRFSAL